MSESAAGPGAGAAPGVRYRSARGLQVLFATVMGSAPAATDATVVGIALPTIGREFDSGLADLQWVVTSPARSGPIRRRA